MGLLVHCSPNFPSVNSKQPQNTPTTRNDLTAKNKERKGGASVSASRLTTYLRLSALMAISTEGNEGNKNRKTACRVSKNFYAVCCSTGFSDFSTPKPVNFQ
jgi:hypothetical protein